MNGAIKLRDEVERRIDSGETFSINEIRQLMKSSGLSYKQIVSQAKLLKKDMDKAKKEAREKGIPFDKNEFIKTRMH